MAQIARHPQRPYTLDYVNEIFTDFHELHGDRTFADDQSIVGGLARFNGQACMVLGHQKGRDTKERAARNFGMPRPEGYRKALRLMKLAEKFDLPVFTFVDTPGAYPGIGAEERGQSEAIGRNIFEMAQLEVPIIVTIIGEGGSGGALAIGVGDQLLMLQYAIYSVISPEGCASILWKTAERAADAAEALGITAHRLKALGLIDKIVNEPVGGAHRDTEADGGLPQARAERRAAPGGRSDAARSAAAPLRAAAVATAASPTRPSAETAFGLARRHRRASPTAAAAIPRRCCMRRCAAAGRSGSASWRCMCTTACSTARRCLARACRDRCRRLRPRGAAARVRSHAADDAACRRRERRGLGPRASATPRWRRWPRAAAPALVLLGHHRRDQAETFLLQALRGGGVAGARRHAALGGARRRHLGAALARRAARRDRGLCAPAPSALRRGRQQRRPALRAQPPAARVWPALSAAFPDAESALAMAATWAQQAADACRGCGRSRTSPPSPTAIACDIGRWRETAGGAAQQCLAAWLPDGARARRRRALVERLLDRAAGDERRGAGRRRRRAAQLSRLALLRTEPRSAASCIADASIDLSRPGRYTLPAWHGSFARRPRSLPGGLPAARAAHAGAASAPARDRFQRARVAAAQPEEAVPGGRRAGPSSARARLSAAKARWSIVARLGIDARVRAAPGDAAGRPRHGCPTERAASPARLAR